MKYGLSSDSDLQLSLRAEVKTDDWLFGATFYHRGARSGSKINQ